MGQAEVTKFLEYRLGRWFTSKEISRNVNTSTVSVTHSLRKLIEQGEVQRRRDVENKYGYQYKLNEWYWLGKGDTVGSSRSLLLPQIKSREMVFFQRNMYCDRIINRIHWCRIEKYARKGGILYKRFGKSPITYTWQDGGYWPVLVWLAS